MLHQYLKLKAEAGIKGKPDPLTQKQLISEARRTGKAVAVATKGDHGIDKQPAIPKWRALRATEKACRPKWNARQAESSNEAPSNEVIVSVDSKNELRVDDKPVIPKWRALRATEAACRPKFNARQAESSEDALNNEDSALSDYKGNCSSTDDSANARKALRATSAMALPISRARKTPLDFIETPSKAQKAHGAEQKPTYSVAFSRLITDDRMEHMRVDVRDPEGQKCASKRDAYIKVACIGPEMVHLMFRVHMKYGKPCYLRGIMNRNLREGRFTITQCTQSVDRIAKAIKRSGRKTVRRRIQLPVNARPTQVLPNRRPARPVTGPGSTWPDLSRLQFPQQVEGISRRQEHPLYGFKGVRYE
ncbi:hypothetical protein Q7P37_007271 [Cladosporium fusiforme]